MSKTIRQWFESVKDEKLRDELLENMESLVADEVCKNLPIAIRGGIIWNDIEKWEKVFDRAFNNEIETL